jgi:formylglycine-generating enzyme required for sulfatase activity
MKKLLILIGFVAVTFTFSIFLISCHEPEGSQAPDHPTATAILETIITDYGMSFVPIPEGTFEMGCSPGDDDCFNRELPRHTIEIPAFKMSAYEITQSQWEAVMGRNPSFFSECGDNCPVECVSWFNIQDFIKELNWQTGRHYRLPTEAEWEYAARAGTTTKYYCGDNETCLDDIAWNRYNSKLQTHPVGRKKPNPWGLYDMSGNVSEWCQDWSTITYYYESPDRDPQGPDDGFFRTVRGGSWHSGDRDCRSSRRGMNVPGYLGASIGLRLCLP